MSCDDEELKNGEASESEGEDDVGHHEAPSSTLFDVADKEAANPIATTKGESKRTPKSQLSNSRQLLLTDVFNRGAKPTSVALLQHARPLKTVTSPKVIVDLVDDNAPVAPPRSFEVVRTPGTWMGANVLINYILIQGALFDFSFSNCQSSMILWDYGGAGKETAKFPARS